MRRRSFFSSLLAFLGSVFGASAVAKTADATTPDTQNLDCFWCGTRSITCVRTRVYKNATEYRCAKCGKTHTRKAGDPEAYFFFPADIERAFNHGKDIPIIPLKGIDY